MKATKTIAALCAVGMVVSTMAMPVQAKTTSKTETEVITMDDTTTTTKAKGTKKSKSSQVSWKNAGKPLQCTVKTEKDFYKAYSNAIRLQAPTLKVTFDKNYKGAELVNRRNNVDWDLRRLYTCVYLRDLGMALYGSAGNVVEHNADYSVVTINTTSTSYGATFPYAYNTGDTSVISKKYKTMYKILSKAADGCTETTDLGKAEYAWNWVIDNMVYDQSSSGTIITKSFDNPTADGKYPGVCEDYAETFVLLMRMLSVPSWEARCNAIAAPKGATIKLGADGSTLHAVACAKIDGEYRYFDPTFGKTEGVGKVTFNLTSTEASKYYAPYVSTYEDDGSALPLRDLTYSELEKYFIW